MQHRFPLGIPCSGNARLPIFRDVHLFPRAPVPVRIVHISAAHEDLHVARAAEFRAPPPRENFRIENIALITSFCLRACTEHKNFAQIAGCGIESASGRLGKCRHLRGCRLQQVDKIVLTGNGKNVSAIPRPCQQMTLRIESQRINNVVARSPHSSGRAIRSNAVHFRPAARSASWKSKLPSRRRNCGSHGDVESRRLRPRVLRPTRRQINRRWSSSRDPRGCSSFLTHPRRINVSRTVDGERRDLFLRSAVQHKAFPHW